MSRAGLYARVSTNDQQTLAMQHWAMREYATRRGWTTALQVPEVNSGAARREAREKLLEAARRREVDVVLVWRLDSICPFNLISVHLSVPYSPESALLESDM